MASAFNTSLYWLVGHHDGIEARAINNLRNHATQNNYGDGIDYWSPTVNMQRDPRWGRNQEVWGLRAGLGPRPPGAVHAARGGP
jgi:beta-glucosidase